MSAAAFSVSSEPLEPSGALEPEWEELAERVDAAPFLRPGWVGAWWRAFGRGRPELVVARRAGGALAALLPLARARGALASPTNWHSVESGVLADSPEAARAVLASLFGARERRVSLAFVSGELALRAREEAERGGRLVLQRTLQRSPYVAVAGTFDAYRRGLSRNLRGDLARRERLLAARGAVELDVTDGTDGLDQRLALGFELEGSGWKDARGTAIRSSAASRRFYDEVARWAARRGWLRLAFLRLDGRALAFDLCLERGAVHWMLKTGYDPAARELSPGKLLRARMIARAFELGLSRYEMLGEAEPWKLAWSRATRERELVQAFRPSPLGRLDRALVAHGRPLARRLRDLARRAGERARAGREPAPAPGDA